MIVVETSPPLRQSTEQCLAQLNARMTVLREHLMLKTYPLAHVAEVGANVLLVLKNKYEVRALVRGARDSL